MALRGGTPSRQVPGSTREGAGNGFSVLPPPSGLLPCLPVAKSTWSLIEVLGGGRAEQGEWTWRVQVLSRGPGKFKV